MQLTLNYTIFQTLNIHQKHQIFFVHIQVNQWRIQGGTRAMPPPLAVSYNV